MPANLTPRYFEAERRYRQAGTPQEKLEALKLMLAEIPKHKGTEKLQAEIKRKIAKTRAEIQQISRHGPQTHSYHVRKEGAGQVVLVGAPNVGKSSLVAAVTHAKPEIADYPFSTRHPCPGMMNFENIHIQLVDLPPVSDEYMEFWVPNLISNADVLAVLVDLSIADPLRQLEAVREVLRNKKIEPVRVPGQNAHNMSIAYKRAIIFGSKFDLPQSGEMFSLLREMLKDEFNVHPLSIHREELLNQFRQTLFSALDVVRVYSKPPGKPVDHDEPFVFQRGSTLADLAEAVHREFASKLRYARIWGENKFAGQRVNRDYILMDGDIVELHI